MTTPDLQPPVPLDVPVAERLALAVGRYGRAEFVERAVALLGGANAGEQFLLWVGGRHAEGVLHGAPPLYWPEVWGARALLHVWDHSAVPAVTAGLSNEAWRVREMCAKVVAAHGVAIRDDLLPLLADDVPRVRAASARALGVVGGLEDVPLIETLLADKEVDVRRTAGAALSRLQER